MNLNSPSDGEDAPENESSKDQFPSFNRDWLKKAPDPDHPDFQRCLAEMMMLTKADGPEQILEMVRRSMQAEDWLNAKRLLLKVLEYAEIQRDEMLHVRDVIHFVDYQINLGIACQKLEQYEEAEEWFQTAYKIAINEPLSLLTTSRISGLLSDVIEQQPDRIHEAQEWREKAVSQLRMMYDNLMRDKELRRRQEEENPGFE